jgi:Tfp pilus assembly major pilin PilA
MRGFSLLELGIVIGVIAILATVVLSGQGFLAASRLSKMCELIDTTSKAVAVYSGSNGGKIPAGVILMDELDDRKLIPRSIKATGVPVNNYRITAISRVDGEHWSITIDCTDTPNAAQDCEDLSDAKANDDLLTANTWAAGATTITFTFEI